jgi:hypothetical protein
MQCNVTAGCTAVIRYTTTAVTALTVTTLSYCSNANLNMRNICTYYYYAYLQKYILAYTLSTYKPVYALVQRQLRDNSVNCAHKPHFDVRTCMHSSIYTLVYTLHTLYILRIRQLHLHQYAHQNAHQYACLYKR